MRKRIVIALVTLVGLAFILVGCGVYNEQGDLVLCKDDFFSLNETVELADQDGLVRVGQVLAMPDGTAYTTVKADGKLSYEELATRLCADLVADDRYDR